LKQENQATERSLGIVKPDAGSIRFKSRKLSKSDASDAAFTTMYEQFSLLEGKLKALTVEYEFGYRFTSNGVTHDMKIHDWEIQAAYFRYVDRYGAQALAHLKHVYESELPSHNLHFVMGTMKAHPRQFIVIGLLRSSVSPSVASSQMSFLD